MCSPHVSPKTHNNIQHQNLHDHQYYSSLYSSVHIKAQNSKVNIQEMSTEPATNQVKPMSADMAASRFADVGHICTALQLTKQTFNVRLCAPIVKPSVCM
jgi:hypothetical protein